MNNRPVPDCEFHPLAVGLGLDALEPSDEQLLRRHLPACAACERTLADTRAVMARIATDSADRPAPASLWESIAARLPVGAFDRPVPGTAEATATSVRLPQQPGPGRSPMSRRPRLAIVTAAALAAVLGLGAWNIALQQQSGQASTVADERATVLRMLERGDSTSTQLIAVDGSPRGTMVLADGRAWLVLDGVGANDSSASTFVLWGLRGVQPVPIATFDVTQSGLDVIELGALGQALDDADGVAVSLEAGRVAPSAPSNRVVATGSFA